MTEPFTDEEIADIEANSPTYGDRRFIARIRSEREKMIEPHDTIGWIDHRHKTATDQQIPEDVRARATAVAQRWYHEEWETEAYIQQELVKAIALAIMDERERTVRECAAVVEARLDCYDPLAGEYARDLILTLLEQKETDAPFPEGSDYHYRKAMSKP